MNTVKLLYIHIGPDIPDYLYDSIYQTLLINNYTCKIYILVEDENIEIVKNTISKFNLNIYTKNKFLFENVVELIPFSVLNDDLFINQNFKEYQEIVSNKFSNIVQFRDGFWVSTTARFFYIETFMKIFNITELFHIENDIMMYKRFQSIYENFRQQDKDMSKIFMVQDAPNRAIPSLLFFPDHSSISELTSFITCTLKNSNYFINDMNLLGSFTNKYEINIHPNGIVYDGAAIGQFLGGTDITHLLEKKESEDEKQLMKFNNPTKGFVNETSVFKPNICNYIKKIVYLDDLRINPKVFSLKLKNKSQICPIANLHIHSKQLYQFSSVMDISYNDIITGDRVLSLCDYVILTKEIHNFHKNFEKFAKDYIIVKDFTSVDINLFNKYMEQCASKKGSSVINLFIYTHILDSFIKYIFPHLNESFTYNFYIHNSDHEFNDDHLPLILDKKTNKVYSQNINTSKVYEKLKLLPLGIANSMWPHGNLISFYNQIKKVYKFNKTKSIYININPSTFKYRKSVLDTIIKINNELKEDKEETKLLEIAKSKKYNDYLQELSEYRFCLCIRGNGIDTHRFWESLYLGVIPVLINNSNTKCQTFINYLKDMNIPFYEISGEYKKKYNSEFFNESLYHSIIKESPFSSDFLKLNFYT